jgi:hypothetical protein
VEKYIGVLAAIVIGSAQLIYLYNTLRKKITPSVLSWFGWGCLMGTSILSQVLSKGWQWSMLSILCSTIGCFTIAAVAFISRNFSYVRSDLKYLVIGLACVGIFLLSNDPWITTVFAVIADAVLGIPTIKKAVGDPALEKTPSWVMGVVSSLLSFLICLHHDPIYMLFPAYLLLFNGGMAWLTQVRRPAAVVG